MPETPSWGDGLSRMVVTCAIYGDLIAKLPGAFTPDLFGESGSPRQRIAKVVFDYVEKYGSRPAPEIVDELIRVDTATLSETQQAAVSEEWQYVQDTDLPDDPAFVYDQVRKWIDYRRINQALLDAADAIGRKGPDGIDEAREILARAEPVQLNDERRQVMRFIGDAEQRLDMWSVGEVMGERVSTGLPALDAAIGGGPTKRETWYFLAPPKGAKTMSLIRVARGASLRGLGVYLTTFEMQAIRMLLRADRMTARLSKAELQEDLTKLRKAFEGMRTTKAGEIYVQEQPTQRKGSVAAVARAVERIRRDGGKIDVVIFDYLNIMGSGRNEKEKRHELAAISREMSDMAKDLDVLVWSAALVNRAAVEKETIKKTDIAEAFEVIAVCDGTVSICAPPGLVRNNARRFYVAAAREEADEVMGGDYAVDFPRMQIDPISSQVADVWIREGRRARRSQDGEEV